MEGYLMATPLDYRDSMMPVDAAGATLVGRVHDPTTGPCVVAVRGSEVADLTATVPTVSDLLDADDALEIARSAPVERSWALSDLAESTLGKDRSRPCLLAPFDLQVIKAAGVTFARSMLERVIEENAKGNPARAGEIRRHLAEVIGGAIASVEPGSAEAARVKEVLTAEGLWSQYLEVGIGPDPEIFTKAPVLASVGTGQEVGVRGDSAWNNPEPEVVLAVDSRGRIVGATLGNDVNLRDMEGRSALLLGEAKDNNASCAIGPFIRLFDDDGSGDAFTLEMLMAGDVALEVSGSDGFETAGANRLGEISRP